MNTQERHALAVNSLQNAAAEIAGTPAARKYRELLDQGESALALLMFSEAAEDCEVSKAYWWHLMRAAELLGQNQFRVKFGRRVKKLASLKSA